MKENYRKIITNSPLKKKVLKKVFSYFKRLKNKELDSLFHHYHEEVFEDINCLECANCCSTTSPLFRMVDIERLSSYLKITPKKFIQLYLVLDEENDYIFKTSPCPFLGTDNYCSVYSSRPKACREYPHTDRKNMHQILNITEKNCEICPAVMSMVQKINQRKG